MGHPKPTSQNRDVGYPRFALNLPSAAKAVLQTRPFAARLKPGPSGLWLSGRLDLGEGNAGILPAPASKLAGDPVRFAQNDKRKARTEADSSATLRNDKQETGNDRDSEPSAQNDEQKRTNTEILAAPE
jgi:hypothetical protein